MANPQKENGHIDIANEIAEKLARYRISGQEYQVLWVIWRKTYGWHKKEDAISLSQISKMTEMKRNQVCRAVKKLMSKNILTSPQKETTYINKYRFNKDFDTWKSSPQKETGSPQKGTRVVPKRVPKLVPKKRHTKETKETIQKKDNSKYLDVINFFNLLANKSLKGTEAQCKLIQRAFDDGYSIEDINNAFTNRKTADWWEDDNRWKNFDSLFRKRNTKGEPVDWVGKFCEKPDESEEWQYPKLN